MKNLSRRKFFGLFGGVVAAAAVPKPLMAMAPSMIVPESTAGNITIGMLQDAFAATSFPPVKYIHVQYRSKADPDGFFHPGQPVYWCNEKQYAVSKNRRGGSNSIRPYAGRMVGPIDPNYYGWIQV